MKPTGMCYVMCELLYHMGLRDQGWVPWRATFMGQSHWWLQKDGQILDPTAKQFDYPFPYKLGKPGGFLTKKPSKRTASVFKALSLVARP